MRIDNVTINITNHAQQSPFVRALLSAALSIREEPESPAGVEPEAGADLPKPEVAPKGERYAGICIDESGKPTHHLFLLDIKASKRMTWADARAWAESIGAELPTRSEAALHHPDAGDLFSAGSDVELGGDEGAPQDLKEWLDRAGLKADEEEVGGPQPDGQSIAIERSQPGTRTARGRDKTKAALAAGTAEQGA